MARDTAVNRQTGLCMNVFFPTFVLTGVLGALAAPALAATGIQAFGSGPDVLISKKSGQSESDFKRACDKRNGRVMKHAEKVVCVAQMHAGSMRGSYGGGRAKADPSETLPPQASQPHS